MIKLYNWAERVVKQNEIDKYLFDGKDFIDEKAITELLEETKQPDNARVDEILAKSLSIEPLTPRETATLINVTDPEMLQRMAETGLEVKRRVYDNRVVFFAPLYCSNLCVNGCRYCGFSSDNTSEKRRTLTGEEIVRETRSVLAEGHKRMIAVFGEHPVSDVDYICNTLDTVYSVQEKTPRDTITSIRRINVNAAPMSIEKLHKLRQLGIGTFQVFQETYHKARYREMHPSGPKANYQWRLYALHRAIEAGVDDVGIGALLGLCDWQFDVMGLVYHAMDLERQFGIGPHTVSVPRLTPANGTTVPTHSEHLVDNAEFKKMITVIRLAIPYTGIIVTARETPDIRLAAIELGCTQTDASSKIGIGAYSDSSKQEMNRQQFMLGDTRSLDEMVLELGRLGMITSFCTAGYRCGRTGDKIMMLLMNGIEGRFCKLNAVLTFREYLDDYASPETKAVGEAVILEELKQIAGISFYDKGSLRKQFHEFYESILAGRRDVYI